MISIFETPLKCATGAFTGAILLAMIYRRNLSAGAPLAAFLVLAAAPYSLLFDTANYGPNPKVEWSSLPEMGFTAAVLAVVYVLYGAMMKTDRARTTKHDQEKGFESEGRQEVGRSSQSRKVHWALQPTTDVSTKNTENESRTRGSWQVFAISYVLSLGAFVFLLHPSAYTIIGPITSVHLLAALAFSGSVHIWRAMAPATSLRGAAANFTALYGLALAAFAAFFLNFAQLTVKLFVQNAYCVAQSSTAELGVSAKCANGNYLSGLVSGAMVRYALESGATETELAPVLTQSAAMFGTAFADGFVMMMFCVLVLVPGAFRWMTKV